MSGPFVVGPTMPKVTILKADIRMANWKFSMHFTIEVKGPIKKLIKFLVL
jgi:hypothetical protein